MPSSERFARGAGVRGIGFPIDKGAEGYFTRRNSRSLRQSSIMMILATRPGERVMLPLFGSRLHELMFEPNDDILQQQVIDETKGAIASWEPNVRVVAVFPDIRLDTVKIYIDFVDLADLQQEPRRMVFDLPRVT